MPTAEKSKSTKEVRLVHTAEDTDEVLMNVKVNGKWTTARIPKSDFIAALVLAELTDKPLKGDGAGRAIAATSPDIAALFGSADLDALHYLAGDGTLQPAGPGGGGVGVIASTKMPLKGDGGGNALGEAVQYVGNLDAIIAPGTNVVVLNVQQTAPRNYILPLSTNYNVGDRIRFRDPLGYCGAGNTMKVQGTGGDTVNGVTTSVELINLQHGLGEVVLVAAGAWGTLDSVRTAYTAIQAYQLIGGGGVTPPGPGLIGELLQNSTGATGVSNGQVINIAALTIGAGEWECWGVAQFGYSPNNTLVQYMMTNISQNSGSNYVFGQGVFHTVANSAIVPGGIFAQPSLRVPFRVNVPTAIYMTADSGFSGGSCTIAGAMWARRVG